MEELLATIRACKECESHLDLGPNPILAASRKSRIIIIGQAPGRIVHHSGIPWDDKSGDNLRKWCNLNKETFYGPHQVALIPMGFCYPGKGRTGDKPRARSARRYGMPGYCRRCPALNSSF
jgi:uracil-DNA glycosylase